MIIFCIGGMDVETSKILAMNLKKYRDRHKITQEALACKVGISMRSYQEIESGNPKTKLDVLDKLADGLGLTLADLLDENLDLDLKN